MRASFTSRFLRASLNDFLHVCPCCCCPIILSTKHHWVSERWGALQPGSTYSQYGVAPIFALFQCLLALAAAASLAMTLRVNSNVRRRLFCARAVEVLLELCFVSCSSPRPL